MESNYKESFYSDEYKAQSAKRTKKRIEDSVKKLGNLNHDK